MRGLFVAGTDTGVGKTVLAAAICAARAARGERVAAFKPALTGLDEGSRGEVGLEPLPAAGPISEGPRWPPDHQLLAAAASAGQSPADVAPYRFGPAVSPHYAAELAGVEIEPPRLLAAARSAAAAADSIVCEGVGGLMVPLAAGYLVRDFAAELGLPLVIAARPTLGTISHTLLTLDAARAAGLAVAAVVMTPWPSQPRPIEISNRTAVEREGGAAVITLSATQPSPRALARAGAALPLAGLGRRHAA
jgi:dethiobiotin synthetase